MRRNQRTRGARYIGLRRNIAQGIARVFQRAPHLVDGVRQPVGQGNVPIFRPVFVYDKAKRRKLIGKRTQRCMEVLKCGAISHRLVSLEIR